MPEGVDGAARPMLRLVTYNVRDLLGDRDAVAHVVRCCRADIVCLQEAPRRRLSAPKLRRLARETGLTWVVGGRASGGTAVLVHPRLEVLASEARRLPVRGPFTRTRGYALARVGPSDTATLTVLSVHLPLRPAERLDHCRRVLARLRELGSAPVAVLGDLNEPPGGPSWAALGRQLRDAAGPASGAVAEPTFPARAPRRRIDAVLVSEGVHVLAVRVAGAADGLDDDVLTAASDHLPLLADVTPRLVAGEGV